ncbi:cadherin repeat domain-containing protein, partial [Moritella yayanosii]|uniref:cadherin repeat domain-containing protein n=1 Tax=Moritella yayanosii TaxID=69539 RepID=UPI0013A6A690
MITFVIPQQAQVISVNGKAEHILEQDSQSLESGYEIAAGGKIEVTSGAQVILKYADGSQVIIDEHFKANDDADTPDVAMDVLDEITESSDKTLDQPQVSDDVLAEIRAIQDLILSDEEFIDPVSTAAGSASDGGRSSAVTVDRIGDETLAHAEFETETFTQDGQSKIFVDTSMTDASASQTVNVPVAADATTATGENTVLEGDVPAATDVDGTVESYQLATDVSEGSLVFNADGSYTFTPGNDFDDLAVNDSRDVTFTYTATDNDSGVSDAKTITITVTGSNDVPVATATTESTGENTVLKGNAPAATDVDGTVESYQLATDVSEGSLVFNADGSYTFTPGNDFDDLAVNDSRDVTFTYTATDNDSGVSDAKTITITVTGSNDTPVFDTKTGSTQVENVAQAGNMVATFIASDLDGDNVTYSISSGNDNNYFEIKDDRSGVVTLTAAGETALANDALVDATYTLGVTANDGTTNSTEATADIKFDGINDAPVIDTNTGSTQVENVAQAGNTVATFIASDLDGDNVTYSISSGNDNNYFEIKDDRSGVVTLTAAGETALANDALVDATYTLGVTANDGTVNSTEATADIKFDGINDAPVIDTNTGSTQVENVAQAGNTVATFIASDLDGDNVTYSISSGNDNNYFEIKDDRSGVVTLTAAGETALANDALVDATYTLGVTANDGTVNSTEATADIKFDGINDAPVIDTNTGSTQVENVAQAGNTVATFIASDLDGDNVTYSISSGNDNNYFEIKDDRSGVVTLTAAGETALANDALVDATYTLGVTANDGTVNSTEATADIKFDGINDAPVIDTNTGSTQVENVAQAGNTVATFIASDLDGDNVTYSISSGNDNNYFEIKDDRSGVVTLTAAGETALANDALVDATYTLGVTANDGTVNSTEATADIKFDGINDAPVIDTNTGSTQVENVAQAGNTVATFIASDLDGDNVTYSISSGNDNNYFEIKDDRSGVVTLTAAGETALANDALVDATYTLGVTANDGTVNSTEATADIKFDGINDAPVIDTNTGSTQVENVAQAGNTVATFIASDLDGDNVTYSISSGNDNNYFEIKDDRSGVVTLTAAGETALANDALVDATYTLGVTANDGTVNSTEATADIKFDGINDAPVIDTNTGSTQVENVAQAGNTVATFIASDLDGDNVTYSISSGNDNNYFEIKDDRSGVVTLTAAGETALANDALVDATYTLGVTANDGTVNSTEATADIKFDGINDAPVIDTNTGSTQVENVAQAGNTVATFIASDLDGDNVTYSISSGNDNNYFEIKDDRSGVVTLTAAGETALANDALVDATYTLGVTAND